MRADATAERIRGLLVELGRRAAPGTSLYLAGGASAVLVGWRDSTHDIDVTIDGDADPVLRAISELKDRLDINVELAGPQDFLPVADWRQRSTSVGQYGNLAVYHTDFTLQALAKLQRGFDQDLADVHAMTARGLTSGRELRILLHRIEPDLYRAPTVDADRLRAAVARIA